MKTRLLRLSLAALTVGCMMVAANVTAQENVLEEIIVTAEKREASIQDTALAITAVSGDLLENGGLDEIEDLSLDVPSLVFSRAGGEAQLYIRGVGTNLFGIGQDSSVAVHQDGVYQGRAQMGLTQFLDVERVEVLRGPQGTLYGRNATAGVINIIHRAPGDEPEGYVNLKLGNFNRYDGEAAYGGPIGENAGFRLAVRYGSDGGFTEDLDPRGGDEVDGGETMAARATLTFAVSDTINAKIIGDYTDFDGDNRTIRPRGDLHRSAAEGAQALPDFDQTRNEVDSFQKWTISGITAEVTADLGGGLSLTSITGYRQFEDSFRFNTDGTEIFVTQTHFERDTDQFSEEIRLACDCEAYEWIAGLYYFTEDKEEALGLPAINFGGAFNIFATNKTDAWAGFGELTWHFSGRLDGIVGVRYSNEEKEDWNLRGLTGGNFDGLFGASDPRAFSFAFPPRNTTDDWNAFTPKLGLKYDYSDDIMLYGTLTRGFKSGGTNSLSGDPAFDPEYLWSLEVGGKSTLADGRAIANATAFYYDYTDLQVSTFAEGTVRIRNAAEATVVGLELDISTVISDQFTWDTSAMLLNAEYNEFVTRYGTQVLDVEGNKMVNAPEVSLTSTLSYSNDIGPGTFTALAQIAYRSEVFHSQFNETEVGQDSVTLANVRAGITFLNGVEVSFVVRNLLDEEYYQNSVRFTSLNDRSKDLTGIGAALGYPGEGRSMALQLHMGF
ncbi:MAG: TonB-dependent receptor plug domain-containing protein [Gammaproteobacteria bacterium]|nr:TonB-dependent receptor plug domain-containing protein [Gammaproteobacteria bacterium]MYD01255.1 TonB-dependent receptor plug domain-containing protein [Gammaproteobacteria bacterium]MYI26359.1 TonB-dependent receptor plug domain-containing protein [Gammaproteobacteria bacterium]